MRRLLRKIVQILDGTPAEYGKRRAGQSVVELALITPILIVLFSGMVEIGWFANNYLTLLDVTRAGARRAATLQNEMAPQGWNNLGSYMPIHQLSPEWQALRVGVMPYSGDPLVPGRAQIEYYNRSWYRPSESADFDFEFSGCGPQWGFYNDIICTMQDSMEPLSLDPENGVDDIIVSAFSLELIDPTVVSLGPNQPMPTQLTPKMVVVGRYPTNANECDAVETMPGSNDYSATMDPRDPFDFNENLLIDFWTPPEDAAGVTFPYIWNASYSEVTPGYDSNESNPDLLEKQVGFVWLGQHRIEIDVPGVGTRRTLYLGSQWSIADVENLINLRGYVSPDEVNHGRDRIPGTGLVLVEMHWQHEMLLKLPVFNPVFNIMSPDGQPPAIYVWAAFPLPSTDPSITFR